jgi:hypothetical protein
MYKGLSCVWCLHCRETADAEEFEDLVQQMLQADSGFSWQDFADFLTTIINRRLATARKLQQQQQQCVDGQLQDEEQQQVAQRDADNELQQQQQCVEGHQQDEEQQDAAQHDGYLQQQQQQQLQQQQQQCVAGHQQGEEHQDAAQYEWDVQQQQQQLQQQQQDEVCHPTAADAGPGVTTTVDSLTCAAAAVGCSEYQSAQTAEMEFRLESQLQMLHCALDLQRAATGLQQVQQAYAAGAAHNAAWCAKHNSSSNGSSSRWLSRLAGQQQQQQHGQQARESSESNCNATAVQAADGVGALPAWVVDAGDLAQVALQEVEQLKQRCESVQRSPAVDGPCCVKHQSDRCE